MVLGGKGATGANTGRVVRIAPNISPTAGHFGHLLLFLVGSWIAQSLGGRLIVRIDWSIKTRGSLDDDASSSDREDRSVGFRRLRRLAEYCQASEVIDEFGMRHSIDGVHRQPVYRVLPDPGERMPIAYDYDVSTLTDRGFKRFMTNFNGSYCRTAGATARHLPLITEQTHVRLSQFARGPIDALRELCVATGQPPRRFHKAYCHLEMDRLLGVTDVVRGNDDHSNRIRQVHELELQRLWKVPLPNLYRIPILTFRGEKICSSEEEGIQGLYPKSKLDVSELAKAVAADAYRRKVTPKLNNHWFRLLLTSEDPLLDAPIWRAQRLALPEHILRA